jgi:hypothetical protein
VEWSEGEEESINQSASTGGRKRRRGGERRGRSSCVDEHLIGHVAVGTRGARSGGVRGGQQLAER